MKRLCVRDLQAPFDERTMASLPPDARIQWRQRLADPDLTRAASWLGAHSRASLRLYGNACEQLEALAGSAPARLDLDAPRLAGRLPSMPSVRDLTLEGAPPDLPQMLAAFASLDTLQADFRGAAFDLGALAGVPGLQRWSLAKAQLSGSPPPSLSTLRALELRGVAPDLIDVLLRIPALRGLRLCGIVGLRSIDALADHGNLRALALESLTHLEDLRVLSTLRRLESLDIAGLWQFSLADVSFLTSMHRLRRLAIDIGGRRKNVEITKKLPLPKPPPFDIRDASYDLTTS
jgi:hypothetical protein